MKEDVGLQTERAPTHSLRWYMDKFPSPKDPKKISKHPQRKSQLLTRKGNRSGPNLAPITRSIETGEHHLGP